MLWPLQIDTMLGARVIRWLGEPMTQYGDALALPNPSRPRWRAAVEAELERWRHVDLIALTRLRANGALAGCGFSAISESKLLSAPFVDFRARPFNPGQTKSERRRARRLASFGEARVTQAATPSERLELLREALALKRQWLRGKGLVSMGLSNPVTATFLEKLAREGTLRAHALRVGSTVAAIDIGLASGGVYRSLLGCYDPRFASAAPGHALTHQLLNQLKSEGFASFDFLPPADPYKCARANAAIPLLSHLAPLTPRGHAAAFALKWLLPLAKRLLVANSSAALWTSQGRARVLALAFEGLHGAGDRDKKSPRRMQKLASLERVYGRYRR